MLKFGGYEPNFSKWNSQSQNILSDSPVTVGQSNRRLRKRLLYCRQDAGKYWYNALGWNICIILIGVFTMQIYEKYNNGKSKFN